MILAALQSAAIRLLGRKPAVFFGAPSSATFELEITDLANEVAQDICQYQDWQGLTRIATIVGDGGTSAYDLPVDYGRQLLDSDLQQPTNWLWGFGHITNLNDFLALQNRGLAFHPGNWTIYAGQLHFTPAPSGEAQFPYITANYAVGADATAKPAFDLDTDTFVLPERLLTLGLVWRWREGKKLDATGDQEAFVKALDEYGAKDKGSSILRINGRRRMSNTSVPYMGVAY